MHKKFLETGESIDPNEVIIREAALTAEHHVPTITSNKFEELHRDFLKEKDRVIASGITGEALANKINDLSIELQKRLADILSAEEYEQLMGMKAGDTINIVNPSIAALTEKNK